ncbi:hypothetical protein HS041_10530 [Planomonospora sp. ID67723]|uniref:hypothetical protein n=1 Tax=Planomonospora sp. ID67723 TaxID=2738134 RepID=UPI0018C3D095|nr:hypothetical protein [Planomonospora sp. ID67723]MBG0828203.1 hypothetical protein [Planomonospora sp. ID67723]
MLLFEIAFAVVVIAGITRIAVRANRPERLRRAPRPVRRRSWLVKAWNASGAPVINGTTLGDASAELTGKAVGATARGGARLTGRAARSAARRAERRWQARLDGDDAPRGLWWRLPGTAGPQDAPQPEADAPPVDGAASEPRRRGLRFWRRRTEPEQAATASGQSPSVSEQAPAASGQGSQVPEQGAEPPQRCARCRATTTQTRYIQPYGAWLCRPCLRDLEPLSDQWPAAEPASGPREPQRPAPAAVPHSSARPHGHPITVSTSTDSVPGASGATVKGPTMTETAATVTNVAAPADWAQTITRITEHTPADDTELLQLMAGEVAGVCGYADALGALHETCVNTVGLDPSSVQGLAEYSTSATELAARMVEAHRQFLTTYAEVMEAVARGVVLPYQGRWFTGAA